MKKGFTLIELLAVIVILAIIALIATPIILGIINDTRSEARVRSAEAVSHAVETAYIMSTLKQEANGSAALFDNNDVIRNTKVENERSRVVDDEDDDPSITTNDGVTCTLSSSYVLTCTYDDEEVLTPKDVKSGTLVVASGPDFYSLSSGTIGGALPDDIKTKASNLTTANYYLGLATEDGETVSAAYVCFISPNDGKEYCIQGGVPAALRAEVFEANQGILDEAFPSACSLDDAYYNCTDDGLFASAESHSDVGAGVGSAYCYVYYDGSFGCLGI